MSPATDMLCRTPTGGGGHRRSYPGLSALRWPSPAAKEKAKTVLSNFRQFIEDNKDEIAALQILYGLADEAAD